ncbi:MAG: carboxypeptidase-like regulatory domain-containing protein, partial [Acidobacteriota bacterium]|nr:carboxypeptidase-like regulatory domain-containing protein [Acidobacteriota bacterium]
MGRMKRVLSATGFVVLATAAVPSSVLAQQRAAPELRTVTAIVAGAINGIVSDDRGGPVPGAMVSVLGATMAMTLTDVNGRFSLQ